MLTQASQSSGTKPYSQTIYQLLKEVEEPEKAVAMAGASWGASSGFLSILRAAGAFAKDNDGYFVRKREEGKKKDEEPLSLPDATHLLVFPVPVEPRMQVAYSYVQGIFLKYLYGEYRVIPREVHKGWAELISPDSLPEADELWAEFLKSEIAESAIAVSAQDWTSGSNIGKQQVDDAFLSDSYLLGLAKAIAGSPTSFQWQAGDQIPAFRKEDLGELANREALMTRNDPEAEEFRAANREKEWNTLRVYGWLEERARAGELPEFDALVEEVIAAIEGGKGNVEVSLLPAVQELERRFREEFVPRSSRQDWTELAIPKIAQTLLLWALVERVPEPETGRTTFLGWDLSYLRHMKDSFDTPELRGSLKFMDKNDPKRGTRTVVRLTGFDKLNTEVRFVPEETETSTSAPFELWNLAEPQVSGASVDSGGKVCTVCGKTGELSLAGILPESKKRHYDNPQANNPADVCARCVQVSSLAPISTTNDNYAIVEVPVENFLQLFALYESIEGLNRLETLKTLNKVSSLSVFPNKYLLLSRSSGRGKMPQVAQYYLQLARQPHFLEQLEEGELEIISGQDRIKLAPQTALTLSVLRRLPAHYVTDSEDKVLATSTINALGQGRPYEALYAVAAKAQEESRGESQAISGGVDAYDRKVEGFGEFFVYKQKGGVVAKEIFRDVREFSDYLDSVLRPIVREEVKNSGSSVSGVARKYTENITKSFIRGNTADFLYRISSFVEGRERQNPDKDGWIKRKVRKELYGDLPQDEEPEEGASKLKIEQELERYYDRYSGNERDWKTFLEEVEARTLALLLLNVRNTREQG